MANHSPTPDNYTENKTWDEIMEGKKPAEKPMDFTDGKSPAHEKNEARGNGSGTASKK